MPALKASFGPDSLLCLDESWRKAFDVVITEDLLSLLRAELLESVIL